MAATAINLGYTPEKGINYTYITDSSADWAAVPNSTYFYDKADKLPHYKDSTGTVLDIFSAASSVNIYNTDGTLTGNRIVTMSGNTLNFSGGNVGINQPTPTVPLHIKSTAIPSTNENIIRLEVSDAPTAYLAFNNAALTDGEFVPEVVGRQGASSTQSAIYQGGYIDATQDAGTTPVTVFRSALASLTQVVTRPLFAFRNWSTTVMTILADGNVGIGTTTPTEKLEVSGKTKTTTFQMTTSPTAGYVLTSDASGNGTWSAAAGGLTYFTEAEATIPLVGQVNSLTAIGSAADISTAIRPKGTGAFILDIGGGTRGQYAVDLQMSRGATIQVAGGNYSFVAGADNRANGSYTIAVGQGCIASNNWATAIGRSNTASGDSSIALGFNSTASNNRSVAIGEACSATGISSVAIGATNTVSGAYGVGIGYLNAATDSSTALGRSNTVSSTLSSATGNGNTHAAGAVYSFSVGRDNIVSAAATNSFVAGYNNTVSADRAISIGSSNASSGSGSVSIGNTLIASGNNSLALGLNSSTQSVNGKQAYASGRFLTNGDAQKGLLVLRAATPSDTPTTLTSDAGVAAATNQLFINTFSTIRFKGTIVGRLQGGGAIDVGVWDIDGVMSRGSANNTLTIGNVNLVTNPALFGTPTLAVDTVNKTLRVQVTGLVGVPAQWVATIETTEVIYV